MRRDTHSAAAAGKTALSPIEEEILQAVRRIRYGSVEITIHDSRVVQIEHKEKVRIGRDESSGESRRRRPDDRSGGGLHDSRNHHDEDRPDDRRISQPEDSQ